MAGIRNDSQPIFGESGLEPYSEASQLLNPATASPWHLMRRMQEEMDRMMSHFANPVLWSTQGGQLWTPNVDVIEAIKHWTFEMDLPGVSKDDINVEVLDKDLVIKAQARQHQEKSIAEGRYHRRERRSGYFERVIPLPENADENNITCAFSNGVLTVTIPKSEESVAKGRHIQIGDES